MTFKLTAEQHALLTALITQEPEDPKRVMRIENGEQKRCTLWNGDLEPESANILARKGSHKSSVSSVSRKDAAHHRWPALSPSRCSARALVHQHKHRVSGEVYLAPILSAPNGLLGIAR